MKTPKPPSTTALLYQTDAYLKAFKSRVITSDDRGLELEESALYPGGGGQPADYGNLADDQGNSYPVIGAKWHEGRLFYQLEGEARPQVGTTVGGVVDWPRRYQLMRTHTALHMLSAVIWRDDQAKVTGGNMEPLSGRLDFELADMPQARIAQIETAVNEEVHAARSVHVAILPRAEAEQIPDLIRTKVNLLPQGIERIRVVTIEGLDIQADGGTHVENTREVGTIRIVKYKSKGKHNKRLYLQLDP